MGAGGQATGYEIDQSIRFNDDDSAHLSRTPGSAGNRKTWTFSAWVKRANMTGGRQTIFSANNNAYLQLGPDAASREMITILNEGSGTDLNWYTDQVFRDPGAWFHVVWQFDTTQASADNRTKLFINGSQVTAFTKAATPAQDFEGAVNNTVEHKIGEAAHTTTFYLDAYLAEIHFIDGTAKTASDFGEYNDDGVWIPKEYSGAYGTQGFFIDGRDSSDLGDDESGNGNDFASSGLAAADQMPDTPTLNHWTLNPLDSGSTLANGNLQNKGGGSTNTHAPAFPKTGKWYVEIDCIDINTGTTGAHFFGICDASVPYSASFSDHAATSAGQQRGGQLKKDNSNTSSGTAVNDGDVIALAFDADNLTLDLYVNNSASGSQITGLTDVQYKLWIQDGGTVTNMQFNFAEASLEYTPPAGYKALSTANLATPTITDGSAYFQATTYTGDGGGAHEINQTGNSTFEPSLVWIKSRSAATNNVLQDQVRGNFIIYSDLANAQGATGGGWVGSFDSDGFTVNVNGPINASGETFVGWQWKANGSGSSNTDGSITSSVSADTASGFSIATYTGTGSNATVGHGLGAVPKMIIIKDTTNAESWIVYNEAVGNDGNLYLNLTNGKATQAIFQDTTPTSSVFSLGTIDGANKASAGHVAYCFAEVDGYSSISSYTGNASTDGPFVYTGFKPAFVMTKCTTGTSDWKMWDNERGPYNVNGVTLAANSGGAESTGTAQESDFLSNGFKIRGSDTETNGSGSTYMYMAFAKNPFGGEDIAPATAR